MSSAPLQKSSLGRLVKIARGGQGTVYRIPDFHLPGESSELVFKEYFAGHTPTGALRKVVGIRDQLDMAGRTVLDTYAAWPCALVANGPQICGIVMPIIPQSFFDDRVVLRSGQTKAMLREVQYLFIDPRLALRLGVPLVNLHSRLTICRDLAAGLALLHEMNLVFGDINAKNAVFHLTGSPTVMLVDCDAVRRVGQGEVVKQLNAPDWDPPEGAILTQSTDRYKFGLFVLRALTPGKMASVRRDADAVSAALDDQGRQMLRFALSTSPKQRPMLSEWSDYFRGRIEPRSSTRAASSVAIPLAAGTNTKRMMRKDPVTKQWVPAD